MRLLHQKMSAPLLFVVLTSLLSWSKAHITLLFYPAHVYSTPDLMMCVGAFTSQYQEQGAGAWMLIIMYDLQ